MRNTWWKLAVGAAALVTVGACGDDNPVDEGVDEVARLDFDRSFASVAPGDSITLLVTPQNRYGNPVIASEVTFEACDDKIMLGEAGPDDAEVSSQHTVVVHGTDNLGFSCVRATAAGVTEEVRVLVVPPTLLTNVSEAAAGETVVVRRAQGQPAFDENVAVEVNFTPAFWLRTQSDEDSIVVVLPRTLEPGATDIVVTGLGGGDASLTAPFTITSAAPPADEVEPNDSPGTATAVEGFPLEIIGTTSADDPDDFYTYSIPEDVTVEFWLEWDNVGGSPDLDFYGAVDPAFTTTFCGGAFTGSYPEHIGPCDLAAGDYMVYVNEWTPSDGTTYHLYMVVVED